MPSCTFLKSGLFTSLQDMGRPGYGYYAVPVSGVMDRRAAMMAALLLDRDNPLLIECTGIPPTIRFNQESEIVLTGADFHWTVNGERVLINTLLTVNKDDVLKGKPSRDQFRAYIGIRGEILTDAVLGSRSTDTLSGFGGYQGRPFQDGDVLTWELSPPVRDDEFTLVLGPEGHYLDDDSLINLFTEYFIIDSSSDRMGTRLRGPELRSSPSQLEHSVVVTPGMVVLPHDGQPIIVQVNGQITGGYPRIGILRDLSRFNQLPLGKKIRFLKV